MGQVKIKSQIKSQINSRINGSSQIKCASVLGADARLC